jgi:hypothetical protein
LRFFHNRQGQSNRGGWQKQRGGRQSGARGKPKNKRLVGNNEQKD